MPVVDGEDIKINLNIDTTVSIDEIVGTENYIDEEGRVKLEQSAENTLKERIIALIKKVQEEYDADIFGFGAKLREDNVHAWVRVSNNWDEVFKDLQVNVETRVRIKNSAQLSKPLKAGD
jgi:spore germination protein KC